MRTVTVLAALAGCHHHGEGSGPGGSGGVTLPDVGAATFVAGAAIDNPLFPLPVGATWVYQAQTAGGIERDEVEVTSETRTVNGVTTAVVRDQLFLDGILTEATDDWYAQDSEGNVWYLGEDSCEYADGACVDRSGSWEWGVDGALPGIAMAATPTVDGQRYYQEYLKGEAEDVGEVVEVGVAIDVVAGSFTGCVRTHDTSTLEVGASEYKTYCPGVGNVREEDGGANGDLIASSLVTPIPPTLPDVGSATFLPGAPIDHPYFPVPVGAAWTTIMVTADGVERDDTWVTSETRDINGVQATVVRDYVYLDDVLFELTDDWYAQDTDGNVWYLGEDSCEYEDGLCVDTHGSWEWGVDGAVPGLIMPADPQVGAVPYRQEFLPGEAEDTAQILATGLAITVPAGPGTDCLETHESTTADPSVHEFKFYCPGLGIVRTDEGEGTGQLAVFTADANPMVLPDVASATFAGHAVDNPYFPLPAGATWVYEATTPDGLERDEITVTGDARVVNGVAAVVVRDTVYLNGVLAEGTDDWYAQDTDGNVWYLGEATCEYDAGGACADTGGSWEWAVGGAVAGIVMPAAPKVTGHQPTYQEYLPGEAEDGAEVVRELVAVTVPAGSYARCVETHDTSTLDPTADEHKVYCPGVGVVSEADASGVAELISFTP